jgi:transcriptional regulator with XRE-family HTH domain
MSTHANTGAGRLNWNAQLMAEDMAVKGWTKLEFAIRAGVSDMTVIRFLRGEQQTAPTAKKLAKALGRSVERYLIRESVEQQW